MFSGERLEELAHGTAFAPFGLFESAANAPDAFQEFLVIQELLISFGALHHNFRLAVYGQDGRFAGHFQPADMLSGVPLEFAQGMNVGEVEGHT